PGGAGSSSRPTPKSAASTSCPWAKVPGPGGGAASRRFKDSSKGAAAGRPPLRGGGREGGADAVNRFRVVLVGRPNVGKSALFNRLARERRALVHDRPGMTRDALEMTAPAPSGRPDTLLGTGGGARGAGGG